MVLYKVESTYFPGVLKTLNNLRSNKEFYDVTLTVGDSQIYSHKNILIAGSDYFKTMFLGPYKEANMAEIDLSATSSDSETLESIVNFLYTGEIEINFESFGPVMKLASALLVSELNEICMEFFLKNLKFETYLDFYFCAVEYCLVEFEGKLEILVKSRFHDKLVMMDKTLNLTPQEMGQLITIGCFQYCSSYDKILFVIDWIERKMSDSCLSVANDILNSVEMEPQELTKEQTDFIADAKNKLSANHDLTTIEGGKQVLTKLEDLLHQSKRTTVAQTGYRLRSKVKLAQDASPTYKDLMITITPRQKVVNESIVHGYEAFFGEGSVLNVCAYDTKSKTWYFLFCLNDKGTAVGILRRCLHIPWEYVCKDNAVFCRVSYGSGCHYIDCLEVKDFSHVCEYDLEIWKYNDDLCSTRLVSAAGHDGVYSVCLVRHQVKDDAGARVKDDAGAWVFEYNFKVHRLEYDDRAVLIFNTPRLRGEKCGSHCSGVSCISDEMIIVYYTDTILQTFVANLKADKPDAHQIYFRSEKIETEDHKKKALEVVILPGKDRFYMVEIVQELNRSKLSCQYEYVYQSGALTQSNISTIYVKSSSDKDKDYVAPVYFDAVKVDNGSIWIFSGNREGASSLTEITVGETGQFCVVEHKPPPFSCITGLFAAQLSTEYLADKRVVKKFQQGIHPQRPTNS